VLEGQERRVHEAREAVRECEGGPAGCEFQCTSSKSKTPGENGRCKYKQVQASVKEEHKKERTHPDHEIRTRRARVHRLCASVRRHQAQVRQIHARPVPAPSTLSAVPARTVSQPRTSSARGNSARACGRAPDAARLKYLAESTRKSEIDALGRCRTGRIRVSHDNADTVWGRRRRGRRRSAQRG
jgi:hypothetical protein